MSPPLINPYWLFGYEVVFNIVLTLITLAISYYSYKAYTLYHTKKSKLFAIALATYALAYLVQAVFGLLSVGGLGEVTTLIYWGTYFHVMIFIMGTVTLAYMISEIERPGMYCLLLSLCLFPLLFFKMSLYLEYILISTLLFYVFINYVLRCRGKTNISRRIPFAFGLLFLSGLHLIFSLSNQVFYILGNILELIAYIVLLINLVVALTK
jgi:hypothetical protein